MACIALFLCQPAIYHCHAPPLKTCNQSWNFKDLILSWQLKAGNKAEGTEEWWIDDLNLKPYTRDHNITETWSDVTISVSRFWGKLCLSFTENCDDHSYFISDTYMCVFRKQMLYCVNENKQNVCSCTVKPLTAAGYLSCAGIKQWKLHRPLYSCHMEEKWIRRAAPFCIDSYALNLEQHTLCTDSWRIIILA